MGCIVFFLLCTKMYTKIPIKMAKIQYRQQQMLMRMWSNRISHSLLAGMQNDTATWEDSFVVSYKIEQALTIHSSNCTPWYFPKRTLISASYFLKEEAFAFRFNANPPPLPLFSPLPIPFPLSASPLHLLLPLES